MYAIEHALLNLGKNKGRNILLGAIILAIITATVIALAIFNTTSVVIEETRLALQSAVRIEPQPRATDGGQAIVTGGRESMLSMEHYQHFAESAYITGADISDGPRGIEAVFFLTHPDEIYAFEADLRTRGLPENYTVRTDENAFERIAGPVESLQSLSFMFLIIVLSLGAVIMILLSAISIRERKYEIGVLRAMGMKKQMVALSLWTEIIIITCICFVIGMVVGSVLSQPISDAIMAGQAQTSAVSATTLADRLAAQGMAQTEPTTSFDVSLSVVTAMQIFGISILLASIAGIVSVSRITKSEPIKILMERA
jgi:putative ABC transport system permease protein